ncbi:PAS domain-containing protein [Candidatus Binatia bacterium]|nr:PAS domain-containing protein [Candidatus Binatia bacterium]
MLIARLDAAGRYVFVNPAYAERYGTAPSAMLGRTVREVVGETLYASVGPRIAAMLSGERVEFEERIAFPVGEPVTVRGLYEPERDAAGRVTGGVAVLVNLAVQVQAIEARRDTELTLRAFFDSAPVCMGIIELLDDGDILHVDDNPESCRFFGVPPGGTRGRRASELDVGAETITAWRRRYLESAARQAPVTFEHRFEAPAGPRWLAVTVALVPHAAPDGEVDIPPVGPRRYCYVADDMTPRMLVQQELAEREEQLRTLADNMSQFAWTADPDGSIFWYNRRWFEYTGTTLDQMRGWGWRAVHHPEHVERVVDKISRCFATGEPWEDTFPLRAADGSYRWFLSRAIPIRDAAGRVVRWFGTNTDVTAQLAAEDALREADRRKDEFLATLAHELRNPLSPIRNAVQVMRMKSIADPDAAWARDVIHRQVAHLGRLVDDLLDVSRIGTGRLDLHRRRADLATILQTAVESARPLLDERGHLLEVALPDEPLEVDADDVRLAQVFTNLLNNSGKYTEPGGRLLVSVTRRGDEAEVIVRDDGIGIAPEALPRVFDMFMQVDRPIERRAGGLGIGLTLVRQLVELHGGIVSAHSEGLGRGTEIRVRLPLAASGGVAAAPAAPAVAPPSGALRILVADDNRDNVETLALMLELQGHRVATAHDGVEALAAAERERPHVAFLDLGMPELNGYDVCRAVRALPFGAEVCVVALTGWGQEDDRRRTRDAGFDHHLVKPVEFAEIESLLAVCVRAS